MQTATKMELSRIDVTQGRSPAGRSDSLARLNLYERPRPRKQFRDLLSTSRPALIVGKTPAWLAADAICGYKRPIEP